MHAGETAADHLCVGKVMEVGSNMGSQVSLLNIANTTQRLPQLEII